MILDVQTITVMIILGSALMSLGLLALTRSDLGRVRGVKQWATATLIQAAGWALSGLLGGPLPRAVSVVGGYGLLVLSLAMYLLVLAEFTRKPVRPWLPYGVVLLQSLLLAGLLVAGGSSAARTAVVAACGGLLMLGSGQVLLSTSARRPTSHLLTGLLFASCGTVLLARSLYQVVLALAPRSGAEQLMGGMNNVTFLTFYATATLLSFGFVLMVSDRYIAEEGEARRALEKSEARHRAITASAYEAIITSDHAGTIVGWNRGATRIFGYLEAEALGQPFIVLIPPPHRTDQLAIADRLRSDPEGDLVGRTVEWPGLRKDGREFLAELTVSTWKSPEGWFATAIVQDITERKAAEKALRDSLREKEGLLKETHHRVKNNLSLITSLMRLSGRDSQQAETKAVLKDMQGRIHSVTLLNEMLYRTGSYTRVDLAAYLRPIATHLFEAHNAEPERVRLVLNLQNVEVETAQAIPCGLIVNELVTNSLKHAFNFGAGGEVHLSLEAGAGGQVLLRVADTGVGLPSDFSAAGRGSLGLQLVSDLARQLQGRLTVGPGAAFTVTFASRPAVDTTEIPPPV